MAGSFQGNIGTATDFQIYKFAVDSGKTKAEILKVEDFQFSAVAVLNE